MFAFSLLSSFFFFFSVNQVSGCEQNFTTHIFALRSAVHQTTPSTGSFLPLSLSFLKELERESRRGFGVSSGTCSSCTFPCLFLRETSRRVRVLRRTITVKAFYSGLPFTAVDVRVRVCRFIISALSRDDDDDAFARPRAAVKDAMNATFFFNVLDNKLSRKD